MACLLHEKPFANLNGSGKHCNWSLNWVDQNGDLNNFFKIPKSEKDILLFRLFVLIQLKAIVNHSKLYMTAIGVPGN